MECFAVLGRQVIDVESNGVNFLNLPIDPLLRAPTERAARTIDVEQLEPVAYLQRSVVNHAISTQRRRRVARDHVPVVVRPASIPEIDETWAVVRRTAADGWSKMLFDPRRER